MHKPKLFTNIGDVEAIRQKAETRNLAEAQRRAGVIEHIVQDDYFDENTNAADLALDELDRNSSRSDQEIAHVVAMRIGNP